MQPVHATAPPNIAVPRPSESRNNKCPYLRTRPPVLELSFAQLIPRTILESFDKPIDKGTLSRSETYN